MSTISEPCCLLKYHSNSTYEKCEDWVIGVGHLFTSGNDVMGRHHSRGRQRMHGMVWASTREPTNWIWYSRPWFSNSTQTSSRQGKKLFWSSIVGISGLSAVRNKKKMAQSLSSWNHLAKTGHFKSRPANLRLEWSLIWNRQLDIARLMVVPGVRALFSVCMCHAWDFQEVLWGDFAVL